MKTFTANAAQQKLSEVLDTARTSPVSITRHGRPSFVVTTQADYDSLVKLKFERLKEEVQKGFSQLDRGEFSERSFSEIAEEALAENRKSSELG